MKNIKFKNDIFFIFFVTLLPQIIFIPIFLAVCFFAYTSYKYNMFFMFIFGVFGFLAMCFLLICISVLHSAYSPRLFENVKDEYVNPPASTITKVSYSYGPKNLITGNRPIYIHKQKRNSGGAFLILVLRGLILMVTGIIQFTVEIIRISISSERKNAWISCREYMNSKLMEEGASSFFKAPMLSIATVLAVLIIFCPMTIYAVSTYSTSHIQFEITDKINDSYASNQVGSIFTGKVTNVGSAKIKLIKGTLYCKDCDGNILYEGTCSIKKTFAVSDFTDEYLEKNESWELELRLYVDKSSDNAALLTQSSIDDLELTIDISEISYNGDRFIEFSENTETVIKPFGFK